MPVSPIWSVCFRLDHFLTNAVKSTQADGWLARTFKQTSVLGTILDPAADKLLMTVLAVTLTIRGLLPGRCSNLYRLPSFLFIRKTVPLAILIIGRDVLLSLSAFFWRYSTLPPPVRTILHTRRRRTKI